VSTTSFRGASAGTTNEIAALTRFGTGEYDAPEMLADSEGTMVCDSAPSAPDDSRSPTPERAVRCPTCGARAAWTDNPDRPFCSRTCRLIDLGVWLDEGYIVPGDPSDDVR
jgi:uncharacterized protein